MKTHNLQGYLLQQFLQYSISELIELNNDLVKGDGWGTDRSAFRTAVISALRRKGLDLSPIISRDDGFTTIHKVSITLSEDNNIIIVG